MITPKNCSEVIKDKVLNVLWDLSAGLTAYAIPFVDINNDYDIISVAAVVTTDLSGTATTLNVGEGAGPNGAADADKFVAAQDTPGAATLAGVQVDFALAAVDQRVLRAGHPLEITSAGSADTGVALLNVVLRPKQKDRGHVSKRPGGSAQAPS